MCDMFSASISPEGEFRNSNPNSAELGETSKDQQLFYDNIFQVLYEFFFHTV